jgi:hypothetical protein
MNIVSNCCGASIESGTREEFPLGGRTWRIGYSITVCERCGKECEEVEACDYCGLPSDSFEHMDGSDYCHSCATHIRELNRKVTTA